MIDIHCHILPGIDDGPKTLEESIAMLQAAADDGVRTVVATPHSGGPYGEPEPDLIRDLVERVNRAAADAGIDIDVVPGCEAQLSPDIVDKITSGALLTLGDQGRYVLMEVTPQPLPFYGLDIVFKLKLAGIVPILAHAERVAGTPAGMRFVSEFARQGGLIQVNVDAIGGLVGSATKRLCAKLRKRGCVHAIASDGHGIEHRPPLLSPCLRGFSRRERPTVFGTYCNLDIRKK